MKTTQRGQALVLIALAIVGLVGFTALAIDGSNVFSDRRHSQNASDTAAYASALALTRAETDWKGSGMDRAISNGYDPADGISEVDVHLCSELPQTVNGYTLTCKGLPTGADPSRYVHVHIKSVVDLYFAPVIGWRHITNHTDAVVLAAEQQDTSFFPGYAIVSTMLGCPQYNHDPFKVAGDSSTTIINAGILVNSSCTSPQPAYDQRNNTSTVVTDTGVCVAGDANFRNTSPAPTEGCSPIDYNLYTLPNPGCSGYPDGKISPYHEGGYIASPGRYGRTFDYDSVVDINPNDKVRLQKGIYCFYDGLSLNAQWELTTDIDGDGHDSASEGVLFYVADGDITFNGSSYMNLHAVDSTAGGFPEQFVNLLIYVPPTNPNDILIMGSNGSDFTGTILAPASYVRLNGGSDTIGLNSQIIGYAVAIEGNGVLDINYNADDNVMTTYNPSLAGIE